jgi:hypothetical protein
MDLAALAISISLLVLVLQIITLVLIGKTRKSLSGLKTAPQTAPSNERDRYGKRDFESRHHEKRNFQDQKPRHLFQQSHSAQSSPPVNDDVKEQSLRDINLRLKNAERDQESARRRLQERLPGEGYQNRNDRGRNKGRDRNHRHGNRDHRRGNWQDRRDRQDHNKPQASQRPVPTAITLPAPIEEPVFEQKNSIAPDTVAPQVVTQDRIAEPDMQPVDFSSEEGLQHGRKIIVKRRPLKEESSEGTLDAAVPANESSTPAFPPANPEQKTDSGATEPIDNEIKFGRR